ncbi:unnamed protein product [Brassicogethes aeneus]|uniref:Cyclin-G-associated kinase n=1 Tax=Brassicogethes aeneus TaxID=1431903 RepID=A0A9P0B6P5_BRAAE|nr:unnamed protein product [Brassicogethes aeneus]
MSDLFKSAFEYFSGPSNGQYSDNSFVGQTIEISNVKLKIKKVISEGGFAVVFVAQDLGTGNEYALKRLLGADEESKNNIIKEINLLKKVSGHPNIIQFLTFNYTEIAKTSHGQHEFLLITELCPGGSLGEILQSKNSPFDPEIIARIFYQICRAVSHMHAQVPPIIHRDLKIENLLISSENSIKLCDFGSATVEVFRPDLTWSANQHNALEENMSRFTTPMYRAPEMVDTWNNHFIGTPVDVWALGCILYTLCYMKHPFEDSAKLRIINANYTIPPDPKYSCFHDIIRGCLQVNPEQRLTVSECLERVAAVAETHRFNLRASLNLGVGKEAEQNLPDSNSRNGVSEQPPPRPAAPSPAHHPARPPQPVPPQSLAKDCPEQVQSNAPSRPPYPNRPPPQQHQQQQQINRQPDVKQTGLFSSLKGGAGSFLKNLKDTSTKVISSVQQTMGRTDLDINYITSRILVMPYPSEGFESAYKTNHIEDVRLFLDSRHPNFKYSVYNLSRRPYHGKFGQARIIDCGFAYPEHFRAPLLNSLYQLCEDIYQYLEGDSRNVVVVHCTDGKSTSATLVCALLIYAGLIQVPEDALQMFAVKRCPPNMQASNLRYLYYLAGIVRAPALYPHYKPVTLISVLMQPVPLFTKVRDGCRPYIEVYSENRCVMSTLQDYERMRLYNIAEGKCLLPINTTVCGDVCIVIYHARNILGGVMTQGKATGLKICQIQFHTGFIPEEETSLRYTKADLDEISENPEHYQDRFSVTLNVFVTDTEKRPTQPAPWQTDTTKRVADTMFASQIEKDETIDNFVSKNSRNMDTSSRILPQRPSRPSRPTPPLHRNLTGENKTSSDSDSEQIMNKQPPRPAPPATKTSTKPLEEAVDFLNLNSSAPANNSSPKISPSSNFDLLSGFGGNNEPQMNFGGFKSAPKENKPPASDIFDPFATTGGGEDNLIGGWGNFSSANVTTTTTTNSTTTTNNSNSQPQKPNDFFADLGSLGGNIRPPSVTPTNGGSTPNKMPPTTPQHAPKPQMKSPDYNRAHFEPPTAKNNGASEAKGKPKSVDVFGDLLGSQGYSFTAKKDQGPRSINEMRKEEMATYTDPETMKVMEWKEGKKNNIRALLCSMHTILWEDNKWKKCEMHQLVSAADVKKAYRRACLAVHPDKVGIFIMFNILMQFYKLNSF